MELFVKSKIFNIISNKISYQIIIKILSNIKYAIANYLKDKYRKFQIGDDPTTNKIVALNEFNILHDELNQQIWLVGGIETVTLKLRLDIINNKNSTNLEIFMKNYIESGIIILTDGWTGYSFLDREDSVWKHEIYNHGHGQFRVGLHSTSNIEHTWAHLKMKLKIYIIYFLKKIIYII